MRRRLVAEAIGTGLLLTAIVGSGIAVDQLGGTGIGGLFVHAVTVGLVLAVLVTVLIPISGAHFNPAVTLALLARRTIGVRTATAYVGAQLAGAAGGVVVANVMFGLDPIILSTRARSGPGIWLSEVVGTAVLVAVILTLAESGRHRSIPASVGGWITVAIVATSSTGFANPVVAVTRTLTDSYTGIAASSTPAFVLAQLVGAAMGVGTAALLADRVPDGLGARS